METCPFSPVKSILVQDQEVARYFPEVEALEIIWISGEVTLWSRIMYVNVQGQLHPNWNWEVLSQWWIFKCKWSEILLSIWGIPWFSHISAVEIRPQVEHNMKTCLQVWHTCQCNYVLVSSPCIPEAGNKTGFQGSADCLVPTCLYMIELGKVFWKPPIIVSVDCTCVRWLRGNIGPSKVNANLLTSLSFTSTNI